VRLFILIISCLVILVACSTPQPSELGRIYFSRDWTIWALNVADGQESQMLDYFPTQGMSVSPDGRWLVYPVDWNAPQPGSSKSLWAADAYSGREVGIVREAPAIGTTWLPDSRLLVIEYPDWHISDDRTGVIAGTPVFTFFDFDTSESISATWYIFPPEHGRVWYAPIFECAAVTMIDSDPHGHDALQVHCAGKSEPVILAIPSSLGDIAWSVDGQFLAFYAGEDPFTKRDTWRLHIWHRETGSVEEINTNTRSVTAPSWSPNGQWLAFENDANLCLLRIEDKSVVCFENYLSGVGHPISWSPDSQRLVLSTCATGVCAQVKSECNCEHPVLATVNVPGGEITLLTTDVDISFEPLWGK